MKALTKATEDYLRRPNSRYFKDDRLHITATRELDQMLSHLVCDFYGYSAWTESSRGMPSMSTVRWCDRFPERKRLEQNGETLKYELPATDMVVERIDQAFDIGQITFEDYESELVYNNVLTRGKIADRNAEVFAKYQEFKEVPKFDFIDHPEFPLEPYQRAALYNALASPGYNLFMEQGTGKTPIVIAKVCNEAAKKEALYRCLVVAPKNVRTQWKNEFSKFGTCPGKVTILRGSKINRVRQMIDAMRVDPEDEYSIVICSYETLSKSWEALGLAMEEAGLRWDLGVLDECHFIKNERTKRWEYAQKLRDICISRMGLTGTPITNTPLDLFTQMEYAIKGGSGFYGWRWFRKFFGIYDYDDATGYEALVGVQNVPFLKERLARHSFIVKLDEVAPELPDKVYDTLEVEMTQEQKDLYRDVRDQLQLEIEDEMEHLQEGVQSRQMVINNILTRLLKLCQVTSGHLVWPEILDEDTGEVVQESWIQHVEENKTKTLLDIIKNEDPNVKLGVWCCWTPTILKINKMLLDNGIDNVMYYGDVPDDEREDNVYRFNHDPQCRVLVGNPASGGVGLNLLGYPPPGSPIYKATNTTPDDYLTNAEHAIYFCQNWSPTARGQSESRFHRKGKRKPTRITDLTIPNTIDEEIREAVADKQVKAFEMKDLQKIIYNVLNANFMEDD